MSTVCSNKKRGRKKKESVPNIQMIIEEVPPVIVTEAPLLKKRGRKPKGGKLIHKNIVEVEPTVSSSNVILHLKCSLKDIQGVETNTNDPLSYNPQVPPEIMTYDDNKQHFSFYNGSQITEELSSVQSADHKLAYIDSVCKKCNCNTKKTDEDIHSLKTEEAEEDKISLKHINSKLKDLRIQFYKNTLNDKKSACFWCSYEFDNQACYIPKYEMNDSICGYGSFCRPECAVGYLMKENIDDSTKFERYQLLNQIYSKVYGYKKNIKPAPNPYYLLDKYYGNLTIQEYRKLLKTEHMLLVIDKPLTRILPELHDDNDEFILNIYGGVKTTTATGGVYKVKRQSEKTQGPTKNSIIKDKFGLSS
jgi:hypothetical protein